MKQEILKKIEKQLLEEKSNNEYQMMLDRERIKMAEANQFDSKMLMTLTFSIISYFVLFIISKIMFDPISTFLITNSLSAICYPVVLLGSSLVCGRLVSGLVRKHFDVKDRIKTFSKAKTEKEKMMEEMTYRIELEKLNNRNIIIDKALDSLNYNTDINELESIKTKAEVDCFLDKEKKQYDLIDRLSTKKVLFERFWQLRNNMFRKGTLVTKALMGGMFALLLYGCPDILITSLVENSVSAIAFATAFGVGTIASGAYIAYKDNICKKIFKDLNADLGDEALVENVKNYNDSFDERRCIEEKIKICIQQLAVQKPQLQAEKVLLGEKMHEQQLQEILFNHDFERIKITKELRDDIIAHPNKYPNLPVRVQMGKFYTDEEYENRANEVLNIPLPGSEKGIVRKRKK